MDVSLTLLRSQRSTCEKVTRKLALLHKPMANRRPLKKAKMSPKQLFDLPPEVRNMIYAHVFADGLVVATEQNDKLRKTLQAMPFQLLQTSKEICEEAWKFRCHDLTIKLATVSNPSILTTIPQYIREGAHRVIDQYPCQMWETSVYSDNFPNAKIIEFHQLERADCTIMRSVQKHEQVTSILSGAEDEKLVEKARKKTEKIADLSDYAEAFYPIQDEERKFRLEINYFFLLSGKDIRECIPDYRLVVDWDSGKIERRYWRACENNAWLLINDGEQQQMAKEWESHQCKGCSPRGI